MHVLSLVILKLDLRVWVSDSVSDDAKLWAPRHTSPTVGTEAHCIPTPPALTPVSQCFAVGKFAQDLLY